MKLYDPTMWKEVKPGELFAASGRVNLVATHEMQLWCEVQGVEVLVAVGRELSRSYTDTGVTWWVEGPEDARVFVEERGKAFHRPRGEKFTNIDRKPQESGTLLEVRRALRQIQLERRATIQALRAERVGKKLKKAGEAPPVEPIPVEPVPGDPDPVEPKAVKADQGGGDAHA